MTKGKTPLGEVEELLPLVRSSSKLPHLYRHGARVEGPLFHWPGSLYDPFACYGTMRAGDNESSRVNLSLPTEVHLRYGRL